MKKKYADCSKVSDVEETVFKKIDLKDDPTFGSACSTTMNKVIKKWELPRDNGTTETILDVGYKWVSLYPKAENYAVIAIYNEKSEFVQFYFDIAKKVKYKSKVPHIYDLYLDVVITKENQVIYLDEEELKSALNNSQIKQKDYDLAKKTADKIVNKYHNPDNFENLKQISMGYLNQLG